MTKSSHPSHEVLINVRDFLMRVALYQTMQFHRNDVRKEARELLYEFDQLLQGWMNEARNHRATAPLPNFRWYQAPLARNGKRKVIDEPIKTG